MNGSRKKMDLLNFGLGFYNNFNINDDNFYSRPSCGRKYNDRADQTTSMTTSLISG